MPEISLTAETGRPTGSRASGRLRADGKVPAIVYGHGRDPVAVAVERRELRAALTTDAGLNALIDLNVGSEQILTIVRDLQRHPVRHEVIHLDFVEVRRDEIVTVEVPVVLTGESEELKAEGGTIEQQLFNLTVHSTPTDIPNELVVDISHLTVGDAVRVGDLRLPEGVTTEVDAEDPVAIALIPRTTIEAAEEEAAAELEEAEAAGEGAPAVETTGEGPDVSSTEETPGE